MNNLKISSSSTKMAEKRSWKAQLKSEDGENFAFSATLALFPKITGFGNDEAGEFKIYSHHNTGITQFIFYQKEKMKKFRFSKFYCQDFVQELFSIIYSMIRACVFLYLSMMGSVYSGHGRCLGDAATSNFSQVIFKGSYRYRPGPLPSPG